MEPPPCTSSHSACIGAAADAARLPSSLLTDSDPSTGRKNEFPVRTEPQDDGELTEKAKTHILR